jgi:hypothetical protein
LHHKRLSRGGISGPEENSSTKMVVTFASWLRIRWSWACWNHHNELYNFIHRNIIVQQRRMKPNGKSFDLAIKRNR